MVVRMRTSKGKRNQRRSHHAITVSGLTEVSGTLQRRHYASRVTGTYKGKEVKGIKKREVLSKKQRNADSAADEKRTTEQASVPEK